MHKGLNLALESVRTHRHSRGDRWWRGRHPVWQLEVGGCVIQLLRRIRLQTRCKLPRIPVRPSRPLKCLRRERARHRVIRMPGQSAIWSERQHYIRSQPSDPEHQFTHHLVEIGAIELAVRIPQHLAVRYAEKLA